MQFRPIPNRLQSKLDRSPQFFARDPTQIVSSPVDPTVAALRIDGEDGQPLTILVNYACHPVVLGAENLRCSADYPAVMAKTVEAAFPNHPLTFCKGGADDIDPYYANTPTQQDPERWRDWTGNRLGDEAVRVAKTIETADEPDSSLDFADDTMPVRTRWDIAKFYEAFHRVFNPQQFRFTRCRAC